MHHMTWAVNFAKAYQEAAPTSQWKHATIFKYIVIKNKGNINNADNMLACIKSQYKQSSHYNELLLYFHCKTTLVWNKDYKIEHCNISDARSISNVICNQNPTCKPLYLSSHKAWYLNLIFICPCIVIIIPNYNQQVATFLDLFIATHALHVSGGSSANHQGHITVHTASGIVNQYCCLLVSWTRRNAVPSRPCRVSVEIKKSRNVASCWL